MVLLDVDFAYSSSREQQIQNSEQIIRRPTIFSLGVCQRIGDYFPGFSGLFFWVFGTRQNQLFSLADGKEENNSDQREPPLAKQIEGVNRQIFLTLSLFTQNALYHRATTDCS